MKLKTIAHFSLEIEGFPTAILDACSCLKIKAGLDFNVTPHAAIMKARSLILFHADVTPRWLCEIAVF